MQLTLSPLNMLLLSILCLAYRLIRYLGIGLANSTPFAQKTEFRYWDHIWCLDIQTLANNLESTGERESQFWGALLAHEWEEALLGSLSAWSCTAARVLLSGLTGSNSSGTKREEQFSTLWDLLPSPPLSSSPGLMKWMDSSSQNHAYKLLSISEVWK